MLFLAGFGAVPIDGSVRHWVDVRVLAVDRPCEIARAALECRRVRRLAKFTSGAGAHGRVVEWVLLERRRPVQGILSLELCLVAHCRVRARTLRCRVHIRSDTDK